MCVLGGDEQGVLGDDAQGLVGGDEQGSAPPETAVR